MEETQAPAEQASETASKEEKPNNIEALERKNRELLEEKKRIQDEYRKAQDALKQKEESELEAQGKYQDINKNLKQRLEEESKEKNEMRQKYAQNSLKSVVRQKALELGATKADAILRLMDKTDLEMIQVDDDFNVDPESALMAVERVQKEYPEFFTKKSAPARGIMPGSSGVQTELKEDMSKMTMSELKEYYKKQGANK